jgi:hypothetical protein
LMFCLETEHTHTITLLRVAIWALCFVSEYVRAQPGVRDRE